MNTINLAWFSFYAGTYGFAALIAWDAVPHFTPDVAGLINAIKWTFLMIVCSLGSSKVADTLEEVMKP